ncbi:MAG: aminodeoxychorismate lyase, partial [Verrucomicrobiales bacterium]|nr:aminodeoxychorismate lyase [Verrucomicrobiales bacterium]
MTVYLNGAFVPEEAAKVSVFDRGFLLGDGLFETLRVHAGRLVLWPAHADRLERGAAMLRLKLPETTDRLEAAAVELLRRDRLDNAVVRITVSRGPGPRGYSIRGADRPTWVIAAHPAPTFENEAPVVWRLRTSRLRLPAGDPVGAHKTTSKLLHVLARAEAEEGGADEALLLDTNGHVAETSSANVFWFEGKEVRTPSLEAGCLAGVTREFVMERLRSTGWEVREVLATPDRLRRADGMFLTLSSLGIVEVAALDDAALARDPRIATVRDLYRDAVRRSIAGQ